MSEASAQSREVIDPWLTWSVPESGAGYWALPPNQSYPGLAQQAIPDEVGYPPSPYGAAPAVGYGDVLGFPGMGPALLPEPAPPAPAPPAGPAPWAGPPPGTSPFYGATTEIPAGAPSFLQSLVGWGLLIQDGEGRHRPTLRLGYGVAGLGVLAGLTWAFLGDRSG